MSWDESESEAGSDYIPEGLEITFCAECECLREAGEALVIRWADGLEELLPLSVVSARSQVREPRSRGLLTVEEWWAEKGERIDVERRPARRVGEVFPTKRRAGEEPLTPALFTAWRDQARSSPDNPLAPVVLRLLRMVQGLAEEILEARRGKSRGGEAGATQ